MSIALIALLVLSAGLSQVELLPGQPINLADIQNPITGEAASPQPASVALGAVWNLVFVVLVWIALPLAVIHLILSPEARRRVLRDVSMLLGFVIFWLLLPRVLANNLDNLQLPVPTAPDTGPLGRATGGPDLMTDAPNGLVALITILVALALAATLVGGAWWLWQRRRGTTKRQPGTPTDRVAEQAQHTLGDLHAGRDFKDTIVRCYVEMSRVLAQHRGVERPADMTPREFQRLLSEIGLPMQPVQQLTRLFEAARYGDGPVTARDEEDAEACLTAIVTSAAP